MKKRIYTKGSQQLRKGRYSSPDSYYFITASTNKKNTFFTRSEYYETIVNTLKWLEQQKRIELFFVIAMPDHVHIVFRLEEGQTLARVMMSFKGFAGREIKQKLSELEPERHIDHVWQAQYYDHQIRQDESYVEIIKYCLHNPVRKGMVEEPKKYPFWWCKYEL